MNKVFIYKNYKNIEVLMKYLDVIKGAFEKEGFICQYVNTIKQIDKKSIIVFPMAIDAFKYYFKGYKNIVIWQQGATADESFMRHHSQVRKTVLNLIDCYMMKKSKIIFFVSGYMKKHYECLSRQLFENKSYVMPCYNEELNSSIIFEKDYSKNVFCYVGSLDLWQCFDQVAKVYKMIEDKYSDTKIKVLTFDVARAETILGKYGIKNSIIKCVPKEEVVNELKEVKYGFVLRDDNIVNRVATPTKLSSYLSAGVIPIFSKCLDDFYHISKSIKYSIPVGTGEDFKAVFNGLKINVSVEEIEKEYRFIFDTYYNTEQHTNNIRKLIRKVFNENV